VWRRARRVIDASRQFRQNSLEDAEARPSIWVAILHSHEALNGPLELLQSGLPQLSLFSWEQDEDGSDEDNSVKTTKEEMITGNLIVSTNMIPRI
jgi:hypothetical protein